MVPDQLDLDVDVREPLPLHLEHLEQELSLTRSTTNSGKIEVGGDRARKAVSLAPRRAAAWNANLIARAKWSEPSPR